MCRLHGPGHHTHDCKVIRAHVEKMMALRETHSPPTKNNKRSYNRTYTRNEVNKIVASQTEKALAKANSTKS